MLQDLTHSEPNVGYTFTGSVKGYRGSLPLRHFQFLNAPIECKVRTGATLRDLPHLVNRS